MIVGQLKPDVVRAAITFNSRANHKHRRNIINWLVCAKEAVMEILIGYNDQNTMMITVTEDYHFQV